MLTPSPNGARWPEPQPLANPGRFRSLPCTHAPAPSSALDIPWPPRSGANVARSQLRVVVRGRRRCGEAGHEVAISAQGQHIRSALTTASKVPVAKGRCLPVRGDHYAPLTQAVRVARWRACRRPWPGGGSASAGRSSPAWCRRARRCAGRRSGRARRGQVALPRCANSTGHGLAHVISTGVARTVEAEDPTSEALNPPSCHLRHGTRTSFPFDAEVSSSSCA